MFDDIKCKVVKATETPDCDADQKHSLNLRVRNNDRTKGEQPDDEEKDAFEFDPSKIGDVFHVFDCLTVKNKQLRALKTTLEFTLPSTAMLGPLFSPSGDDLVGERVVLGIELRLKRRRRVYHRIKACGVSSDSAPQTRLSG